MKMTDKYEYKIEVRQDGRFTWFWKVETFVEEGVAQQWGTCFTEKRARAAAVRCADRHAARMRTTKRWDYWP